MVQSIDHPLKAKTVETGAAAAPSVVQDRRRVGRVQQVSSTLIPLLRDPAHCVRLIWTKIPILRPRPGGDHWIVYIGFINRLVLLASGARDSRAWWR